MIANRFIIKSETAKIEPLCCLHVANVAFDEELFLETVRRIKQNKNRYTIILGDLHDSIYPNNNEHRYDPDVIDYRFWPPDLGYEWLRKKLKRISNKIIGIHTGNHDDKLRILSANHNFVKEDVCKPLKVKYLNGEAFTKLILLTKDKQYSYIINSAHGSGNSTTLSGAFHKLEKLPSGIYADIYLRGHTHQIGSARKVAYYWKYNHLIKKRIILVSVGSFFDSFKLNKTSYAERKDYLPTDMGTVTIILSKGEAGVHV